ncbi:LpqB family beta-propeller domain-containing protein [Microbacterium sp. ARD32]|uniref:LpqB family beta-propeller domain-containing protein n=1 Tax=Microbacterium sp. ARD32 TaxID=2962577 RepID=UPI002882B35F|nr:LpqB family beta-propeller domain-containing protein [Microbacterium sp. ARD32]MDT0156790.1 LpqB family beta-propeller domain-containing protein [Microbacterium sp. ARD32]
MRTTRALRLAAAAAIALLLAGCSGLPTSGPPNAGLTLGEEDEGPVFIQTALDPQPGDSPENIVKGFLEASMTPTGNWEIAQKFLTDDFRQVWKPDATVTIDTSIDDRAFSSSVPEDDETATSAQVQAEFAQVASVDAAGTYSADASPAKATYQLERDARGEWRISKAKDGIVLDAPTFLRVYQKYSLKYFDASWTHLVPDVRWFPRRPAMATTIARALVTGQPAEWLAPAVHNAFSTDMSLAGDAVTVDASQVASVALSRGALTASPTDLARMRTQLEASLSGAGVSEVRLTVDGAELDAGLVSVDDSITDAGVLVQTDDGFGRTVAGDTVEPVGALSAQLAKTVDPIGAVDVSLDASLAAMQLRDGHVFAVTAGNIALLDDRADLIEPSLDPFGFVWTVPRSLPGALEYSNAQLDRKAVIAKAWQVADSISQLRVSADGARVAAVVTSGGQRRVMVAAVMRGKDDEPTALGEPQEIGRLAGPAQGLAWIGTDSLAVLTSAPDPVLTTFVVGGPSSSTPAPDGADALAGAKTTTGLRVLGSDGALYAQRGSSWQVSMEHVLVLGRRAGY